MGNLSSVAKDAEFEWKVRDRRNNEISNKEFLTREDKTRAMVVGLWQPSSLLGSLSHNSVFISYFTEIKEPKLHLVARTFTFELCYKDKENISLLRIRGPMIDQYKSGIF